LTLQPLDAILNQMVQYKRLDAGFGALSDQTRRGVLEVLGRRDASISDLASHFAMTLTGMKKHIQILEKTGLVKTKKTGRVRNCTLGSRRLERESTWIENHRVVLEARMDRLGEFLERTKGEPS
jgi:DNA-binding transcriptional ArsR family regulator